VWLLERESKREEKEKKVKLALVFALSNVGKTLEKWPKGKPKD